MTMMGFRFFKQCQQCHKNVFILYNFSVNCLKTDILPVSNLQESMEIILPAVESEV